MVPAATVALIVLLVGVRLLLPPVPNLLKTYLPRWGTRATGVLCAISLAVAVILIALSKR
jgi:hypothetical protein